MNSDPILFLELPIIQKIIHDETWLEGERRGCWVDVHDPVVRENVCQIVLRIGQQLREALNAAVGPAMVPAPAVVKADPPDVMRGDINEAA